MRFRLTIVSLGCVLLAQMLQAETLPEINLPPSADSAGISLDSQSGLYQVRSPNGAWSFSGTLGVPFTNVTLVDGKDAIGSFIAISFLWNPGVSMAGEIRRYDHSPVVWFRAHYIAGANKNGVVFPNFNSVPSGLYNFSYQDRTFSPPNYSLAQTSTPWLLFDGRARAVVVSPASQFMVSTMLGDGKAQIGEGLGEQVQSVPRGFNQDTVMVFADGIGSAWDRWGTSLQALFHKRAPANDADVFLKDFGYWTDNGADYYYNYDLAKGYAPTLEGLVHAYRLEGIPLGYLQLDSWWYQKSTNDPAGHPGGAKKSNRLPVGSWNRYGGLMEYRAHPDLFPDGLASFQRTLNLPLAVHSRWIDRASPYHDSYKISGVGAVDPAWWKDTAAYLKESGVSCYEQDWLDEIYMNSPEMASTVGVGDAFTDGMANATRGAGLSMQYCMGTPRFFLQGLKYQNLTTIRTSGDRFEPRKWANFLYVSRLARNVGIWPWCDVFKSAETGNMIVAVLSAGPVGTGDELGKENKTNILMAARSDGVIVKPDESLLLSDQVYLDGAEKKQTPFIATTFTDHAAGRATYVFAFPRSKNSLGLKFSPKEFGWKSACCVHDFLGNRDELVGASEEISTAIGPEGFAYFMIVPISPGGISLLGDLDKFVPLGKQRIASVSPVPGGLKIKVMFAPSEKSITLQGVSLSVPTLRAISGSAALSSYQDSTRRFAIEVRPRGSSHSAEIVVLSK